eukprot:11210944-Alexandrium_andersonii.AAC.1
MELAKEGSNVALAVLVLADVNSSDVAATAVQKKARGDDYAHAFILNFIRELAYERAILQGDQEKSLMALLRRAAESRPHTHVRKTP